MKVDTNKTVIIDSKHAIEFGESSWNPSEKSVRRRKNNTNGTFDPFSSSEIPINGHVSISTLIVECLKNDLIQKSEMTDILNQIIESNKRQDQKLIIQ